MEESGGISGKNRQQDLGRSGSRATGEKCGAGRLSGVVQFAGVESCSFRTGGADRAECCSLPNASDGDGCCGQNVETARCDTRA